VRSLILSRSKLLLFLIPRIRYPSPPSVIPHPSHLISSPHTAPPPPPLIHSALIQLESLKRLACAKHFEKEAASAPGTFFKACKPLDFDLLSLSLDDEFFKGGFHGAKHLTKSLHLKDFTEHLGDNKKTQCYHLSRLPGFSSNYAVLVGMCPAEAHGRQMAFVSVQVRFVLEHQ
jgi:hypothetical protein